MWGVIFRGCEHVVLSYDDLVKSIPKNWRIPQIDGIELAYSTSILRFHCPASVAAVSCSSLVYGMIYNADVIFEQPKQVSYCF